MEEYNYIVKERFIDHDGSMKMPGEHVRASVARAVLLRNNGKIGGMVETATAVPKLNPEAPKPVPEKAVSNAQERRGKRKR